MRAPKHIVWIKENGTWVEQGDGPMTLKDAERVAREIRHDFRIPTMVLQVGLEPSLGLEREMEGA